MEKNRYQHETVKICLFIVPLENFSLKWLKVSNFDLCSALMAIEQWGFLSVPHLLWHGASVYNGHLRGPVTLTPIAERLAVELSLPVFTTKVCRGNRYETRHTVVLRLIEFIEGCLFDSWLLNSHRPDWRFLCKTLENKCCVTLSPIQHRHKKMCTS